MPAPARQPNSLPRARPRRSAAVRGLMDGRRSCAPLPPGPRSGNRARPVLAGEVPGIELQLGVFDHSVFDSIERIARGQCRSVNRGYFSGGM